MAKTLVSMSEIKLAGICVRTSYQQELGFEPRMPEWIAFS